MKTVYNVIRVVFALFILVAGINKFTPILPDPPMPDRAVEVFTAFSKLGWLLPLVGVAEVVAGLLLLTRRYAVLGALILLPVMVGILLFNSNHFPAQLPMAAALLAINLLVLLVDKEKIAAVV
ncbi:MAG: DoxX family protein [Flavobacteriaceae bacterium]|nr:MAG: DoxX family protein [Flavobacteriaceae bacterium]